MSLSADWAALGQVPGVFVTETVEPSPSPSTDTTETTEEIGAYPGAFWLTFIAAIAVTLLVVDMVRRLRRMRYRDQAREQLAEEYGVTDQEFPEGSPVEDDDRLDPIERKKRKVAEEDRRWEERARRRGR